MEALFTCKGPRSLDYSINTGDNGNDKGDVSCFDKGTLVLPASIIHYPK